MFEVELSDTEKPRYLADGSLVATAAIARSGIQEYTGTEMGGIFADRGTDIIRVWRPVEEVTDTQSVKDFSHLTITNDHPPVFVDTANWRDYAVGETSTIVKWEGNKLHVPLIIKDKATVEAIKGGKSKMSVGYKSQIEVKSGTTPEGQQYDCIQRKIRPNHLAIVDAGRAGKECGIMLDSNNLFTFGFTDAKPKQTDDQPTGDDKDPTKESKDTEMPDQLYPVKLGDSNINLPASCSTQVMDAWNQAEKRMDSKHNDAIAELGKTHNAAIETKDAEITALKDDKTKLEAKCSDEAIGKLVAFRSSVIDRIKLLNPETVCDATQSTQNLMAAALKDSGSKTNYETMPADAVTGAFNALCDLRLDGEGGAVVLADGGGSGGDAYEQHMADMAAASGNGEKGGAK